MPPARFHQKPWALSLTSVSRYKSVKYMQKWDKCKGWIVAKQGRFAS